MILESKFYSHVSLCHAPGQEIEKYTKYTNKQIPNIGVTVG